MNEYKILFNFPKNIFHRYSETNDFKTYLEIGFIGVKKDGSSS